jgi:DNA-directed RNA polymerase specialized sigma24 family protein
VTCPLDEATVARMHRAALNFAKSRCWLPDPATDAEDIVNAAWARVLPNLTTARPEREQTNYLISAVVSVARDRQRYHRHRQSVPIHPDTPERRNFEDQVLARVELESHLTDDRRGFVHLLKACGYQGQEIARLLGIGRGTLWRLMKPVDKPHTV